MQAIANHEFITMDIQDGGMEGGSIARASAEGQGESVTRYAAFLLRVWHTEGDAGGRWRFVLEEVGAEERHGFGDWDALAQHIRDTLTDGREPQPT